MKEMKLALVAKSFWIKEKISILMNSSKNYSLILNLDKKIRKFYFLKLISLSL